MTNKIEISINLDFDKVLVYYALAGKSIYLNDWSGEGRAQVMVDFDINEEDLQGGVNIIVASYTRQNYSGSAFVLFLKGNKLYEVHGSHCSCNGLEGQWVPEEASIEFLRSQIKNYREGGYVSDSLCEAADTIEEFLNLFAQ